MRMARRAFSRAAASSRPSARSTTATFFSTVSQGKRAKLWNTMATPGIDALERRPVVAAPRRRVARIRPATMRRIVDLPQPEGPSRASTSLGRTSRVMSSSTRSGLPPSRSKDLWTPFSSQIGLSATAWPHFVRE